MLFIQAELGWMKRCWPHTESFYTAAPFGRLSSLKQSAFGLISKQSQRSINHHQLRGGRTDRWEDHLKEKQPNNNVHWRAVRLLPLGKLNSPFLLYNDLQQCVCERVCVFHLLFLGGFKWLCVFIPAKRVKRDRKSSVIKFQLQLQVFISHFEQTLSLTNAHTHPEPSKTHLFQWLQGHQKVSELKNLPEVNCSPFEADTAGNHTHTHS